MNQEEKSTLENKSLVIQNQFDSVEFSLIKEEEDSYRVIYSYVKSNNDTKKVEQYCTIFTGITGTSIPECAVKINELILLNLFYTTVISIGVLFDKELNYISDIDWNDSLMIGLELNNDEQKRVLH